MRPLHQAMILATAMMGFLAPGAVEAGSISGHVVQGFSTTPDNAPNPANPSADFTTSDINFNTGSSPSTTLHDFLNNPTFTNQQNGFDANLSASNIFVELTGQTFLHAGANSFVVGHDDGAILNLTGFGNVVDVPQDTSFSATPFTVTAAGDGLVNFDLRYHENGGGPANLVFQVNGAPVGNVPEPATLALFGVALAGLGLARRRRSA